MAEHQICLRLDADYHPAPAVETGLRAEIAVAWGLPLGQRVEVSLRNQPCALQGIFRLATPELLPRNEDTAWIG